MLTKRNNQKSEPLRLSIVIFSSILAMPIMALVSSVSAFTFPLAHLSDIKSGDLSAISTYPNHVHIKDEKLWSTDYKISLDCRGRKVKKQITV